MKSIGAFCILLIVVMTASAGGPDSQRHPFLSESDYNNDGQVTLQEWNDSWNARFTSIDRNQNSKLEESEMNEAPGIRAEANRSEQRRDRIGQMDSNGDGEISRTEWKGPGPVFDRLDADGNEQLSERELFGTPSGRITDRLKEMDSDHDGKVSRQEYDEGIKVLFQWIDRDGDGVISEKDHGFGAPPRLRRF